MSRGTTIVLASSIGLILLIGVMHFMTSKQLTEEVRRVGEDRRALAEELKNLNTTIASLHEIRVSIHSLPSLPAPVCTVTMPPEPPKKKRGQR